MFRSARWRGEKNKIKSMFKLQFHATQVAQPNVDALMISVVPGDVGKPTVRLEKAIIRDGVCQWENSIYETIKFIREPKTGKINERLYYFIVSTGSSKASVVGEVSIDFADYAEETKASTVSLPLKNSNSKALLHVTIQRLHANVDRSFCRDVEESEEDRSIKSQDRSLKSHLSNGDTDESIKNNSTEDGPFNKITHNTDHRASSVSDMTMSSSDSSSGLDTPRELGMRNTNIQQDPTSFLSYLSNNTAPHKPAVNGSTRIYEGHHRSQWDWSEVSDHGLSTDDSTNSSQDTLPREISLQASDNEIEKLKAELVALARQADMSELELQTLRKQIVKENKRGQDLTKEVTNLKDERDALKAECEKLKAFHNRMDEAKVKNKLQFEVGDPWALLEELRQELNYEKELNANLRLQLQKTQDSNAELLLAVQDLDEMLEQKNRDISDLSNKSGPRENAEKVRYIIPRSETDDDEEQKALEELVKEHSDTKETYLLEQQIMDLHSEIEIYRRDKDELEMQMEQLALDYEIMKQENHDISYKLEQSQLQEQLKMQYECSSSFANINELETLIESLENELKKQSKESSDSLATIKDLETHIMSLEEELENQAQGFEADLEAVTHAKVKQEQRAILAEEALRMTRWKNINTAERLQDECRRLSEQMVSTFHENERVAMKALTDAGELRLQKSQQEAMLKKAYEELQSVKDDYEAKLYELSNQLNLKANQVEQMLEEIVDKSKQLEQQKKHEEELNVAHSQEILKLKAEIDRLRTDVNLFSEQAEQKAILEVELEQMKTSNKETEVLLQRGNVERNELVSTIALVKKEAEKLVEELNRISCLKDEKERAIGLLQSELETLKSQCNDLKHSLFEDELEKEKLRKQVFQLKGDLKKKEEALTSVEKKLKDSSGRAAVSGGTKPTVRNNKSAPVPLGSKEVANLREKIKLLEGQIKLKEAALETSTNKFLEKERDLKNKIDELESRVEELNQSCASFNDHQFQRVEKDIIDSTSNSGIPEEASTPENRSCTICIPKENGNTLSLNKSDNSLSEAELKAFSINSTDGNHVELLSELVALKERNQSMESELKEMQERYSEISLKFAEVEGERQKLVMTVRYLKNSKKS